MNRISDNTVIRTKLAYLKETITTWKLSGLIVYFHYMTGSGRKSTDLPRNKCNNVKIFIYDKKNCLNSCLSKCMEVLAAKWTRLLFFPDFSLISVYFPLTPEH